MMSVVGRNSQQDVAATLAVVHAVLAGQPVPTAEPNWLGHSFAAAAIDRALVLGASVEQLRQLRKTEANHRYHLKAHGISIEKVGKLLRFCR